MRRLLVTAVALVTVAGFGAACTNQDDQPGPAASPGQSPVTSTSTSSSTSTTAPTTPPSSPSTPASTASTTPTGGSSSAPVPVTPTTDLLHWTPVHGSVDAAEITNGTWTLTVSASGASYDLSGGTKPLGSTAAAGYRVGTALLDKDWAVAVFQDKDEEGTKPDRAQVTDLVTGQQFFIDDRSDVPTTVGGTWAIGGDTLVHATKSPADGYCLATVDLESGAATRGYCAAPQHGFNAGHVTPSGTTLLTFDSSRPSCRTVGSVSGATFTPFPGVAPCKAWEGVRLEDDSAVWSVIPKENRVEAAEFLARVGDSYYDLGPGTSGTLVPCHGAAYFVRDPQRDGQPAALMRWDGSALTTVYQAPPGQSFLATPRCGDDDLTVTAFSESGDEQVTAPLG